MRWRGLVLPLALVAAALAACAVRARPPLAWPAPTGKYAVEQARYSLPTPDGPVRVLGWLPQAAGRPAPLVLYAPGWGNRADDCAALLGDLASHGYVVIAFDDVAHDPARADEAAGSVAVRTAELSLANPDAFRQSSVLARQRTTLAVRKGTMVLDAVLAAPGLAARIDPGRIGFVGYSFGGASGVDQTLADPRLKAVVNLDGWLFGKAKEQAVRAPYLLVSLDEDFPPRQWHESADPGQRAVADGAAIDQAIHRRLLAGPDFAWLRLSDMAHSDLSDAALRWNWRRLRHPDSADPGVLAARKAALNTVVRQFLDTHVKGDGATFPPAPRALPPGVYRVGESELL